MTTARIWIAAAHDPALKSGGWALVRANGEVSGLAGGDRRTTRARMALAGLIAALKDVPASAALTVVAPQTDARVLYSLVKPPEPPPADDLDLRAVLTMALSGREFKLMVGDPAAATPLAFAAAWAELARDKAKSAGAFLSAIPKTNLAKVKGL